MRTRRVIAALPMMQSCLARLKMHGLKAEGDMLAATGGVNTHKGEIFSLGLISAAWARLTRYGAPVSTGGIYAKPRPICLLRRSRCARPQRGAAVSPHRHAALALNTALLILQARSAQNGMDTAACAALTALMAQNEDTNIVRRAGEDGLEYVKRLCTYADAADAGRAYAHGR
ncbi:MAG: triphosphoribosyl-dephospho-CoA synthase [Christensenellales bacterium]